MWYCRRKWKDLCLPERGGSREKLMLYLNERAEAAENSDEVRALVRAIISLFSLRLGIHYSSQARSHFHSMCSVAMPRSLQVER